MATVTPKIETIDGVEFVVLIPECSRHYNIYVPINELDVLISDLQNIKSKICGND